MRGATVLPETIEQGLRAGLRALALLVALSSAAACGSEPAELYQRMQVSLHGGGRSVDADLTYACRKPDASSPYAYVPEANGALYVAADGEAVAVGGTHEASPGLCTYPGDKWNGGSATQTPLILWIDNINRPGAVDVMDPGPETKQARFLSPELVRFSMRSSPKPLAPSAGGRVKPLSATYGEILSPHPGGGVRFAAPARVVAALEFADDAERSRFRSLLGREITAGAREISFCNLARLAGGSAFLRERHPALIKACKAGAAVAPGTIRFSVPLPMKRVGGTHWAASSADNAASFVTAGDVPLAERGTTPNGDLVAESSAFWGKAVSEFTWVSDGGRRYTLPVRGPQAIYFADGDIVVVLSDDVSVVYLTDPTKWVAK